MLEARVFHSIREVGRAAWEACAPEALEGFDYLAAVEAAGLEGFDWRYLVVEEAGRVVAAAPAFLTDYSLDTTLSDLGRRMIAATRRLAPRAFILRMACLGSPCTEDAALGFAPELAPARRVEALGVLLQAFEQAAADAGCSLLAVKDAPGPQAEVWSAAARAAGYQATPGMPGADLAIDFADLDGYLATLGAATRKDMRRKLKAMTALRIEVVDDLTGLEDRVHALYRQTRARSDLQFEDLTPAYFTGVLGGMPGRAFCVLYWFEDALVGCNLLLQDRTTLLDKFFCMQTGVGRRLNLYFVSWFVNVRLCLERGLTRYRSGQAGYASKLRLGSQLVAAQMYFRHRHPLVNGALRWAAPLLVQETVLQGGAA
jgi:predicted N-acyltransferase